MGKWKTPSKTDYENLIAGTVLETFGAGGVQYRNTTTDQKVTFNEAGWIAGLAGCIVSNTTDGKYWTSTVHETLSTRAYSFEVDNSLSTTFNTVTNDYDRSAMSIRCVRVL